MQNRFSKIFGLLTVALFLVSTVLPTHVGHLGAVPHSSGHDRATAEGHALASHHERAGVEHQSEKDQCDHAHELACSLGHCCYPVPEVALTNTEFKEPRNYLDIVSADLRDKRVDLPPPRSS